jgi:ribonucleoside-diphosphate reductase alpha chain
MKQIKKRDGRVVDFDDKKIGDAIRKAFAARGATISDAELDAMSSRIVMSLEARFGEATPMVEHVQDAVEMTLMLGGYLEVAKAYIVYRYEHTKIRQQKQEETLEKIEEHTLNVTTTSGKIEPYNEPAVRKSLERFMKGYESAINVDEVISQLRFELYEGIKTTDIKRALIMVVRSMIERDPAYSKLAAKLFLDRMYGQVFGDTFNSADLQKLHADVFARNIEDAISKGALDPRMKTGFDLSRLAQAFKLENDNLFEYMGLEILSSRYCMEDLATKKPTETPQMFWMRIAMGLSLNEPDTTRMDTALAFYDVLSGFYYTPGGRTLFQAGALKPQLSNCFLNSTPDSLDGIFKTIGDNAQYLKYSGGTGTDWTKVRATGSLIKGTGVPSQGIVPFLKIANDVNLAINRSGKRRGAGCVYLETWHADIEDFLELRKNTGDERRRTHDINTANWIPDLFMKRVRANKKWTLFSPSDVPDLHDLYGAAFEKRYEEYEAKAASGEIEFHKTIDATDLWKKMLAMLFETGHPWITWKDPINVRSPQDHVGVVHNSNLCTEITLNTSDDETAVCTIGSLNFAKFVSFDANGKPYFDRELVGRVTKTSIRMLDNIIDLNFYPTEDARRGNTRHRPVGLGVRGYHDALYLLGIHFDSHEALDFADESMEVVAYHTIMASSELAKEKGSYSTYKGSKWDRGIFPQDTISLLAKERGEHIPLPEGGKLDWTPVREHVKQYGMRNSNTMAIAPTASTANLVGCVPCVEPIYKNIYVKSNKEGDFVVVNKYLVEDLKARGLWSPDMLNKLKFYDGSVQDIEEVPSDLKRKYREVFEIPASWLIEAAARRGRWMDQSQSLNIFYSGTSGRELSEIYFMAWERGLKTTYYLRTLGASQVEKASVSTAEFGSTHNRKSGAEAVAQTITAVASSVPVSVPISIPAMAQAMATAPAVAAVAAAIAPPKPAMDAAFLAKVAAGEAVGICESCEG